MARSGQIESTFLIPTERQPPLRAERAGLTVQPLTPSRNLEGLGRRCSLVIDTGLVVLPLGKLPQDRCSKTSSAAKDSCRYGSGEEERNVQQRR